MLDAAIELGRTPAKVVALLDAYARHIAALFARANFDVDLSGDDLTTNKEQHALNEKLLTLNYQVRPFCLFVPVPKKKQQNKNKTKAKQNSRLFPSIGLNINIFVIAKISIATPLLEDIACRLSKLCSTLRRCVAIRCSLEATEKDWPKPIKQHKKQVNNV